MRFVYQPRFARYLCSSDDFNLVRVFFLTHLNYSFEIVKIGYVNPSSNVAKAICIRIRLSTQIFAVIVERRVSFDQVR